MDASVLGGTCARGNTQACGEVVPRQESRFRSGLSGLLPWQLHFSAKSNLLYPRTSPHIAEANGPTSLKPGALGSCSFGRTLTMPLT